MHTIYTEHSIKLIYINTYANEGKDMFNPTCFYFLDPSIKPKPTTEVDPTVFEKRFLKKVRDLGEVNSATVFMIFSSLHIRS